MNYNFSSRFHTIQSSFQYITHMNQIASGVILFYQGRILLLRASNHGTWSVPKGYVDKNESLIDTALRETFEETGIESKRIKLIKEEGKNCHINISTAYYAWNHPKFTVFFIGIISESEEPNIVISDEHDSFVWADITALSNSDSSYVSRSQKATGLLNIYLLAYDHAKKLHT